MTLNVVSAEFVLAFSTMVSGNIWMKFVDGSGFEKCFPILEPSQGPLQKQGHINLYLGNCKILKWRRFNRSAWNLITQVRGFIILSHRISTYIVFQKCYQHYFLFPFLQFPMMQIIVTNSVKSSREGIHKVCTQ